MVHRGLGGQVRFDAGKGSAAVTPARTRHRALGCGGGTASPQAPWSSKAIPPGQHKEQSCPDAANPQSKRFEWRCLLGHPEERGRLAPLHWRGRTRMEYFQLEGTYNDHLGQLPSHFRADQKLKHVTKGIVQI